MNWVLQIARVFLIFQNPQNNSWFVLLLIVAQAGVIATVISASEINKLFDTLIAALIIAATIFLQLANPANLSYFRFMVCEVSQVRHIYCSFTLHTYCCTFQIAPAAFT
jgi:hypothetical protein